MCTRTHVFQFARRANVAMPPSSTLLHTHTTIHTQPYTHNHTHGIDSLSLSTAARLLCVYVYTGNLWCVGVFVCGVFVCMQGSYGPFLHTPAHTHTHTHMRAHTRTCVHTHTFTHTHRYRHIIHF